MRNALILGGAAEVFADAEAALELGEFHGVFGVNYVGIVWPGQFDAFISLHGEKLKTWAASRARRGLAPHKALIGGQDTERRFPSQRDPGSSSLFALKVALVDYGFDRAVLCGVPLTKSAHFDDAKPWKFAETYHDGWRQSLPHIGDRTRSMGGWTAELLGRPDAAFLA